jgi:uncharacterized protein (DUF302 family)
MRRRGVGKAWILMMLVAVTPTAAADLQSMRTEKSFDALVAAVEEAVTANEMIVVTRACASCGAASRAIRIPGNMVLGVFRNHFAVRMLQASVPAGIEAPIRFYVTEEEDGTASLHYRTPSDVFAPYDGDGLDAVAAELDTIFARIAADATGG